MDHTDLRHDEQHHEVTQIHPWKEIAFGAVSGMVGKLVEFPFDTIKVRLQSNNSHPVSTMSMISRTFRNEGFMGFYKGLKAPLLGACLENAVLFSSYNFATGMLQPHGADLSMWSKCASGGFAGFMASFILTPVELVKCQLQVANLASKSSLHTYSSVIGDTLKRRGVIGLWNGLGSTMVREVVGTSIWFGTYEYVNEYFAASKHSFIKNKDLQLLFSGAMAGVLFNFSMFPVDTIKSNIQTHDILAGGTSSSKLHHHKATDFWKETKKLCSKPGGVMNLYNGLGITMIRCIPANALIFYTYELLKRNF
ncbi:ORT1 [Candida theae]|uniref:Mitochondrial thiamine pyrophosphate carrier 1 n=1 Tax=Candida theae TaxID=1198502 RepID=A0AAD5BAQ0_9ASCO|nr:ORT1 [Candida theae]KAI5949504.1 ORT1 [Candida theae]